MWNAEEERFYGQSNKSGSVKSRGRWHYPANFDDAAIEEPSRKKSKKKKEKKNKQKAETSQANTDFITLPAPMSYNGSPAPMSGAATTSNGSPAPRPGFSRITSNVVEVDSPREGTPLSLDKAKVVIGLNKRRAGEEAAGTPPPKRR